MRSISIPFRFEGGRVASTTDEATIAKQRIIDALTTDAYERVNRPGYGLSVNSLLFDSFDELIFSDYRIDAIRDLNDYVSNARITDFQVRSGNPITYNGSEENTLVIRVMYRTLDGFMSSLVLNLSPDAVITEESTI